MDLDDVQRLMEQLYGEADRARGIPATVAWLCEELGELAQAVRKGTQAQREHEFADVVAWVASLANQVGVDLTTAVERYAALESRGWKGLEGTAVGSDNVQGRFYDEVLRGFAGSGGAKRGCSAMWALVPSSTNRHSRFGMRPLNAMIECSRRSAGDLGSPCFAR